MLKKLIITAAALSLPLSLFAGDKAAMMKDMAAQEAAMSSIQKSLLYSSKSGVVEGVAALKAANKAATLKEGLKNYLPDEKKALYKLALKEGEKVNKYADEMVKKLEAGKYEEAFTAYGKVLNSCNTCHVIIRSWK